MGTAGVMIGQVGREGGREGGVEGGRVRADDEMRRWGWQGQCSVDAQRDGEGERIVQQDQQQQQQQRQQRQQQLQR